MVVVRRSRFAGEAWGTWDVGFLDPRIVERFNAVEHLAAGITLD